MGITLPPLAPGLVAFGVYAFLQARSEFIVALVILQSADQHILAIWSRAFLQQSLTLETGRGQVIGAWTPIVGPVIVFSLLHP